MTDEAERMDDSFNHKHKFTIPVEWKYTNPASYALQHRKEVTRLRCECGEEVGR